MSRNRVYVPVSTSEYARIYGVSARTARRRIAAMPGAVRSATKWTAPIPAKEYAQQAGISVATARRRGISVTGLPQFAAQVASPPSLRTKATQHWAQITGTRGQQSVTTIEKRLRHASKRQLGAVQNLQSFDDVEIDDDEWQGDDGVSILYYH